MERGLGYVAVGSADASRAFLESSHSDSSPRLWVTGRFDMATPDGTEVVPVTRLADVPQALDPKHLGGLRDAILLFLKAHPGALVVLDCLEPLVLHNGVERVERALADLHDEITVRGATLVVFVDAEAMNPRLVAWLERELDSIPASARPQIVGGLLT